jgi:hydroxyethylthiazole kinase-like uncharacterized protein yjeF
MDGAWPVAEIRAAEQRVMARVPAGSLMQRAAQAVAVEAGRMLGFCYGAKVLLLVGAGDNGGDALFAGAQLARRGAGVRASLADPARAHQAGLAALHAAGGRVGTHDLPDLIIDGLVGIGASGRLRDNLLPLVKVATAASAPVLSVDIPSGVDPDTGAVYGPAVAADVTVCMGALKPGLLVGAGREHAGELRLIDIGIVGELAPPQVLRLSYADVSALLPRPSSHDDKYTRGVVGVAAGSQRYPGAAQLCVGAARLGGVGAVRYAGHAAKAVSEHWPEVLVSETVAEAGRVQAWVVGPGFGDAADAEQALVQVLGSDVPVLIDADGLNLLAKHRELLSRRSAATVLTPHDREFARLFGEVGPDRLGAARRAAADSGATVLLKGFATIVAEPGGRCFANPTGHPSLATAGSGDVLAGLIGSLMAAHVEPTLAAAAGAYLHGEAAADGIVSAPDLIDVLHRRQQRSAGTSR